MKLQKKILVAVLLAIVCMLCLAACGGDAQNTTPGSTTSGTDATSPSGCAHNYEVMDYTPAMALKEGSRSYVCSICEDAYVETLPATKTLKVLALGNSFTNDGMTHLWDVCKSAGVETVIVANLYRGSCTLDRHWGNIKNSTAAYTYYKNTDGKWNTTDEYKVRDALLQEDWDYIVLHQTSGSAGLPETFSSLGNIINYINQNKTNPNAKIIWHMPWAYQSDSDHEEFAKYENDQMKMYQAIVSTVNNKILRRADIAAVIPAGTAIQNLRTSYIGDTATRDGEHLNQGFGRYTSSLTWYAILTGGSIDLVDWKAEKFPEVAAYLPILKEAAKNAIATPYAVTPSQYTENDVQIGPQGPVDPSAVLNPADYIEGDTALAASYGVDLSNYTLLEWEYTTNAYWYCTQSTSIRRPGESAQSYNQNIATAEMLSVLSDLPVGTVFICDPGWKYRFEIWKSPAVVYDGDRPAHITIPFYVLTEEYLDGARYVAWNVSANPTTQIDEIFDQAYAHIRVYVPKQ